MPEGGRSDFIFFVNHDLLMLENVTIYIFMYVTILTLVYNLLQEVVISKYSKKSCILVYSGNNNFLKQVIHKC